MRLSKQGLLRGMRDQEYEALPDGCVTGEISFFLFYFIFIIMYSLFKVQETIWSASYDRNKTHKQSNDPLHPLMGKIKPLQPRAHPPPQQHLRRKQDEAIPSSRHVRKDKYRKETRERHKPFGGPPKTKEKILTAPSADREGR